MSSIGCLALIERSTLSLRGDLLGLHGPIGEAISLALDRGIEHLDRVRIVLVREHGAFRVQYEADGFHLRTNGCRLNPMQARLGEGGAARELRLGKRRLPGRKADAALAPNQNIPCPRMMGRNAAWTKFVGDGTTM